MPRSPYGTWCPSNVAGFTYLDLDNHGIKDPDELGHRGGAGILDGHGHQRPRRPIEHADWSGWVVPVHRGPAQSNRDEVHAGGNPPLPGSGRQGHAGRSGRHGLGARCRQDRRRLPLLGYANSQGVGNNFGAAWSVQRLRRGGLRRSCPFRKAAGAATRPPRRACCSPSIRRASCSGLRTSAVGPATCRALRAARAGIPGNGGQRQPAGNGSGDQPGRTVTILPAGRLQQASDLSHAMTVMRIFGALTDFGLPSHEPASALASSLFSGGSGSTGGSGSSYAAAVDSLFSGSDCRNGGRNDFPMSLAGGWVGSTNFSFCGRSTTSGFSSCAAKTEIRTPDPLAVHARIRELISATVVTTGASATSSASVRS